jgi:CBS domain-containing protein
MAPESSAWVAFLKTGRNRTGRVAVVDRGRLVGTVTRRDLEHAAALERLRAHGGRRVA